MMLWEGCAEDMGCFLKGIRETGKNTCDLSGKEQDSWAWLEDIRDPRIWEAEAGMWHT